MGEILMLLKPTFKSQLTDATRPLVGIWNCAVSTIATEICAGSGVDWLLIDVEHSPNTLDSVLAQLHVVETYPVSPLVRLPVGDATLMKQFLDIGAQNILIPMVETAEQAQELVAGFKYPPVGRRGVGAALARSARWNRVEDYLENADEYSSLFIQIESGLGVENLESILAVEGIDGIFIGPADLAASIGRLGQSESDDVREIVKDVIARVKAKGIFVGVNAFTPSIAREYMELGVDFIAVTSDVSMLARSSETVASEFIPQDKKGHFTAKSSY